MWRAALVLSQLLALCVLVWAQEEDVMTPQDCSLDCIQEGRAGCEYCRINRADVRRALGFKSIRGFGSCVPWPCFELLGREDPQICQHYVHAPNDVEVEYVQEPNPTSDTIVVSWKPSHYGIAFLRGFQVFLQALGGSSVACQLFLFHRNLSLPVSHSQTVYKSDPFPGITLGSQYAVSVMALPVPEKWEKFTHSKIFSTRSCAEKNGLEQCKKDWYPKHIEVLQEGPAITVTFNLAPPHLSIHSYFSVCYAKGLKTYTDITPANSSKNKTHHSYQLNDLQEGTNYTCEIAANEMDAVRKTFDVQVMHVQKEDTSPSASVSWALLLPLCLAVLAILGVTIAALITRTTTPQMKKDNMKADILKVDQESEAQMEVMALPGNRRTPPRLLICYSSNDGPAHVKAVMQLAAFIQRHMATQVCLDLWDSLSVCEEGPMAWHCRQICHSDFILVMCSAGLNQRSTTPPPLPQEDEEEEGEEEEADEGQGFGPNNTFSSDAAVQLIGEEVGRAKTKGQDLSKYMAAIFDYSEETDIPTELRLVSHYRLPADLPLLFSHLHGVALHRPGAYLKIGLLSGEAFAKSPASAALQWAIYEAGMAMREKISMD